MGWCTGIWIFAAGTDITKSAWNGRSLAVDHNGRDTQYDHEYLLFYEIQKNME